MSTAVVTMTLNGVAISAEVVPGARLSEVLRERLGARDVKVGCNAGDCGACTVLIDGEPVCACMVPAARAEGAAIETLAGLVAADALAARLKDAFLRHGAAQCGICTPGVMVAAVALLRRMPLPGECEVKDALAGVLCRCTGYRKIIDAVLSLAAPASATPAGPNGQGIGAAIPRLDGLRKVMGSERFGDDVAPADALAVRVVRSPHHHARFVLGDLDAYADANPGVAAVLTAADVPGVNRFGVIPSFIDQPVFAEGTTRFRGEAIAAVVGAPAVVEALDLDAFPVSWTELPALSTPDEAEADGAALLHENRRNNLMCGGFVRRGDVDAGLAAADVVVEGEFETGFIEHAYIEPEAGFARRVGDRIEIHACTQAPFLDRDGVAAVMGLPPASVRIVPTAVGGGFGSKLDLSVQPYVALAAWTLNRPVRIAYTRKESMQSTTKRHPSRIRLRIGAANDGRIVAFDFDSVFNTGAYASWGPTVAVRVPVHASGPYRIGNYRAHSRGVYTHCAPAGAFRGFGVPQSAIAQESLFDELADALGLDRLEFRRRNALQNGVPTVTGQVFDKGVGIGACLDAVTPHWQRARREAAEWNAANGAVRRGVGIASGWYGCGNTSLPNPSTIKAGIRADGAVVLHQGAVDIGQGANTVIAQIFAEALGVAAERLELVGGDTDVTPDAGKTSASRQTFVSGNAARLTGEALRAEILRLGNVSPTAEIVFETGAIRLDEGGAHRRIDLASLNPDAEGYVLRAERSYDPPTKPLDENGQGDPYAQFGYAVHMVELEVDVALGVVTLLKFTAAHDVGKAINPILVEGQVQGGVAQGVGLALMEEFIPGRTENLHDYLIPTFGDIPPIETLIVEVEDAHGPYGAKGLGEHVLIPTAPAILNAIRDATGARIRKLPATPDRVRAAIRAATG
jgi:CO/xanthine dehydrogenase Mo-binding subunit/aerobic-type carbon monoxide dehydrogenase small subunit (CoxS/CutS family)